MGSGTAQSATNNPPLYYALQAAPYWLGSGGSLLDRIALMRLLSVLMAAGTAFAVFAFLREVMPGAPWAWSVGRAGGRAPAAVRLRLLRRAARRAARAGRRTRAAGHGARVPPRPGCAHGALLGAAAAVGLLSKLAFLGLVPGIVLAVALAVRRGIAARRRPDAVRGAALALGIPAAAAALYALASVVVWDRSLYASDATVAVTPTPGLTPASGGLREELSYIWQLYLPRLPFMEDLFPASPIRRRLGGGLPRPLRMARHDRGATGVHGGCDRAAGGVRPGCRRRPRGRGARSRVAGASSPCYAVLAAGLLVLIGRSGYSARLQGGTFEQARYLVPLLGLYAGIVALAARSAGPRWGPVLGAILVVAAFGHDLFAQLLVVGRFWA